MLKNIRRKEEEYGNGERRESDWKLMEYGIYIRLSLDMVEADAENSTLQLPYSF